MAGMDKTATEIRSDRLNGAKVVGRTAEIGLLSRVLDAAGPRVCFVYGLAGIGKSSLLAQFRAVLAPIPELVGDEGTLHEAPPSSAYSETFVEDYLRVFGRPHQREAWRTRTRFVAEVRENPIPVPL